MQRRRNKYQRENIGHVIETTKEQAVDNVKGKDKAEAVATKNKFDALEREEIEPPMLQITSEK